MSVRIKETKSYLNHLWFNQIPLYQSISTQITYLKCTKSNVYLMELDKILYHKYNLIYSKVWHFWSLRETFIIRNENIGQLVFRNRFHPWNPPDFTPEIHQISWNRQISPEIRRISWMWAFGWWSSIGLSFERPIKAVIYQTVELNFSGVRYRLGMNMIDPETSKYLLLHFNFISGKLPLFW